jgi:hypothetical protein
VTVVHSASRWNEENRPGIHEHYPLVPIRDGHPASVPGRPIDRGSQRVWSPGPVGENMFPLVMSRSVSDILVAPVLTVAAVCIWLTAVPSTQSTSPGQADARQERLTAAVARVYDPGVLHRIEITIAPDDARTILNRTTERVRCTFSFDGVVLRDVGIRQAGGTFNRFVPIDGKPTLSVKFDDFVRLERQPT